ncbi:MAG: hypothetical protein AB1499_16010 [Nitrospirota bacterium]
MTKVTVNSGNCGFTVFITAEKEKGRNINISLVTGCDMIRNMLEDISLLDMRGLFSNHTSNPVYRAAAKHLKHAACPVPCAILKAAEVELGLCLPQDVTIQFTGKNSDGEAGED